MESQNVKTARQTRGTKKLIQRGGRDEEGSSSWKGFRPWVGGAAILLLMGFEYWFISNGFQRKSDGGWGWPISILVPMAGTMTFLGILFIANIFSKKADLTNGEMRKAITGGILVTYMFFIMIAVFAEGSPVYRLYPPATDTPSGVATTEPAEATEAAPTEAPSATEAGDAGAGVLLVRLQETQPPPTGVATEPAQPTEAATEAPAADSAEPPAPTDAPDAIKQLTENQQVVDTPVELASSIINAFTSLVAVVIGFYFSTRSIDYYNKLQALSKAPELLAKFLDEED